MTFPSIYFVHFETKIPSQVKTGHLSGFVDFSMRDIESTLFRANESKPINSFRIMTDICNDPDAI